MTDESIDPIDLFKIEAYHDDTQVQLRAVKKLPTLAVALDVDRTRHELIPCLEDYMDVIYFQNDEVLSSLAEQLGKFSPFIGGSEYVQILLPMLAKLASIEDLITREKSVESLQNLASSMNGTQLEMYYVPVIEKLCAADWFTSKCSAAGLFAICYTKLSEKAKTDVRKLFTTLLEDESPMVRRAAVLHFADFINVIEMKSLKGEFIPIFDNLAKDDQDSVRSLAVNVGIAIASRLNTKEIEEFVLTTLENLGVDLSWRVRYQVANEITSIQTAVGPTIMRKTVVNMYKNLIHDSEANIREISAKKIVQFCEILQKSYSESDEANTEFLDPVITNEIFPLIKELGQDAVEDVVDGLYSVITSLGSLLGQENTKDFLLPLITSSIEIDSSRVKENIITNLNNIICVIGIEDLTETVHKLLADLVNNSTSIWRTRRNLIVTLSHIAKHSKREYFDEQLKPLYVKLLNDAVYGVRKVAPLVLPIFAKHFGMSWARESIVTTFLDFSNHTYYLFRLMCLFGIDELVAPTLETINNDKYLSKIKGEKSRKILNQIFILNETLQIEFEQEWIKMVLIDAETDTYFNDDVKTYAEETLNAFNRYDCWDILAVSDRENTNEGNEESYLEGLLFLINAYFLETIHRLAQDKVVNVRIRAVNTLSKIVNLSKRLQDELNEEWVTDVLNKIPSEEDEKQREQIKNDLLNAFQKSKKAVQDEQIKDVKVDLEKSSGEGILIENDKDNVEEAIEIEKTDMEAKIEKDRQESITNIEEDNQETTVMAVADDIKVDFAMEI